MDRANRLGARLEALLFLGAAVALALLHAGEIRWPAFALLFLSIDLAGWLPGAIAHRRSRGARTPRLYHALYNVTHSFVWNGAVAGVWCAAVGPEWALLAIPIHLVGDRALFGNFFKPFSEPFERSVPA